MKIDMFMRLLRTLMNLDIIVDYYVGQNSKNDDLWHVYIEIDKDVKGTKMHVLPSFYRDEE